MLLEGTKSVAKELMQQQLAPYREGRSKLLRAEAEPSAMRCLDRREGRTRGEIGSRVG